MPLTLLIGGVRSGKSATAVRWAIESNSPVTMIATAEARDVEMEEKIRRHKEDRPSAWTVIESPIDLETQIDNVDEGSFLIIDCLTLWISNLIERGLDDREIEETSERSAKVAAAREMPTIAITNEVGLGIIPANALARRFGEVLGNVNKVWAEAADEFNVMIAGRIFKL